MACEYAIGCRLYDPASMKCIGDPLNCLQYQAIKNEEKEIEELRRKKSELELIEKDKKANEVPNRGFWGL